MLKSGKSFVKIGSRSQIALFILFYRNVQPPPPLAPPYLLGPPPPVLGPKINTPKKAILHKLSHYCKTLALQHLR